MAKAKIRVELKTRDRINSLRKFLKRKHNKAVNQDEAIEYLFEKRTEVGRLETKVRTLVTRNEELELEVETLTKGASTEAVEEKMEGLATKTEAQTPTETGEPSIKTKEVETPSHQTCTFYTKEPDKEVVHCSKDYDRKGIIHPVTDDVCAQCWKRLQKLKLGAKL